MADKNKGGRPLKFKSAKELQQKIDDYFESCYEDVYIPYTDKDGVTNWRPSIDKDGDIQKRLIKPFTITGLALALDTNRQTLINYEENEEYFDTIKKAKARIENFAEEQLYTNKNVTGVIFNLKNNYGWTDKQEIDQNIGNKDDKPFVVSTDRAKEIVSKMSAEQKKMFGIE